MKNFFISLVGGLLGGLIILAITLTFAQGEFGGGQEQIITTETAATEVYNETIDGVVTVLNYQSQQTLAEYLRGESGSLVESGIGSGFIYKEEDGYYYALTNEHVVSESEDVKVIANGQSVDDKLAGAEIVGVDAVYDVAVIKFKSDLDLTVLDMGDSDLIKTGEDVFAIGSPYGTDFAGSISSGILAAPIRKFDQSNYTYNYIQTDAAINPGNSGGPLINSNSEVVEMNSMKIADGQSDNMGFAIPINIALGIAMALEDGVVPSKNSSSIENYTLHPSEDQDEEQPKTLGEYIKDLIQGNINKDETEQEQEDESELAN